MELWSSKVEILSFKLWIRRNLYDLRDLKMVYSILESRTTGESLGKRYPLSESGTRNKMAAKFRIDGSRLARDNFPDVLN